MLDGAGALSLIANHGFSMLKACLGFLTLAAVAASPAHALANKKNKAPDPTPAAANSAQYTAVNYDRSYQPENVLLLDLSNGQRVAIRLMPEWAPEHVKRIKTLAADGFYNNIVFHRVIDGFMAQTGDPTGTGQGGSSLPDLKAEFNVQPHLRGSVSMARAASEDSANSQFFIVFYPRFSLDKKYTVFGRVIENMAAVDAIVRGEPPENPTRIVQASLASENKPMPAMTQPAATAITADDLNKPIAK